jgi:hypothetical protein
MARVKSEWGNTKITSVASGLLLAEGKKMSAQLAATRAADLGEVEMKITELLEWLAPDLLQPQEDLLRSILKDVQNLRHPVPADQPEPKAEPEAKPAAKSTIRVDRRARPVMIGETLHPSIAAAARATGRSYKEMQRA